MPRVSMIIAGSIPVIIAILLIVPLFTTEHVPPITLLPTDTIEFEYTQRSISTVPGVIEREQAYESRVLEIDDSGHARLLVAQGTKTLESDAQIDADTLHRLRALVKETGFIEITPVSFLPDERADKYELYVLGVTLNGIHKNVRWITHDTQEYFVPPIIIMIQQDLDSIRATLE